MTQLPTCRMCGAALTETFVDLGMSPLCESYVPADKLDAAEVFYPLHVRICSECLLVQLPAYVPGEDIYSDYAYFSSYSDSWVAHAKRYADRMVDELSLTSGSLVTEVASNDGYLLQHFVAAGIRVLGVEGHRDPEGRSYFSTPVITTPRMKTRWNIRNRITGTIRVISVPAWISPGSCAERLALNWASPTARVWSSGLVER